MRKGPLFLSVVLTTFMLAILAAGASAYQNLQKSKETAFKPVEAAQNVNVSAPVAAPAATAVVLTPEQASALAAKVIGRIDLYSVETTELNGASVFMVTFSSGDVVYVSLDGQILSITKIEQQVVVASAPGGGGSHNNRGNDQTITIPQVGS